jgi:hypothetical protein
MRPDGYSPALVAFVVSLNLKRRHLDSGQRAFVALEVERVLGEAARERQREAGEQFGRGQNSLPKDLGKLLDGRHDGEAAAQAAQIIGTNRRHLLERAKTTSSESVDLSEIRIYKE